MDDAKERKKMALAEAILVAWLLAMFCLLTWGCLALVAVMVGG